MLKLWLRKQKQFFSKTLLLGLTLLILAPSMLATTEPAAAAPSTGWQFKDVNTIELVDASGDVGALYIDGVKDQDYTYHQRSADHGCKSVITYEDGTPQEGNGTAYLWKNEWLPGDGFCYFDFEGATNDTKVYQAVCEKYQNDSKLSEKLFKLPNCLEAGTPAYRKALREVAQERNGHMETISIAPGNFKVNFYLVDGGAKLISVDGEEIFSRSQENNQVYFRDRESVCPDKIDLKNNIQPGDEESDGKLERRSKDGQNCSVDSTEDVFLGLEEDAPANLKDEQAQLEDEGSTGDECQQTGILGWIVCPIVYMLSFAVDSIHSEAIEPLLRISPLQAVTNPGATCDPDDNTCQANAVVYEVWQQFRNLANIMFVIVFFVIIISQATSIGLDAYSIKKMLPRLVVAVIAVQLSFYIAGIMIDVSNIAGAGVRDIIEAPFDRLFSQQPGVSAIESAIGGLAAVGVTGVLVGVGLVSIMPLLTAALLTVLITVLVLGLRSLLIYILVIAAPLAFVAMVLPSTESWFKTWWSFFFRALMMYPIIEALFALSKVLSKLAPNLG